MNYSQQANPNATNSEMDSKQIIKPSLTSLQRDGLIEQFVELVVDGMDTKDLVRFVSDNLTEYYEDLYDELVDNVTNETVVDTNNNGGKY